HQFFSEDELGTILQKLLGSKELTIEQHRNVERTFEDYTKNKKYTSRFVRELSEQTHKAFHSWIRARRENSFSVYEKDLDALIQLKKQEADLLGYQGHPYNALLDEFEKGSTVDLLDKSFKDLLPTLEALIRNIES